MVPPGGPSAIYGFLFQILKTLEWALKIDLDAPEHDTTNVTIIAEPPGGDVDIRYPRARLVQQFKVRDGAWSLKTIVEKVLPDLYRAITDEDQNVAYQFVTNGWMGEWAAAHEFFRSLRSRTVGDDPLESVDASKKRFELHGKLHSERSLLVAIVNVLRNREPAKKEDEATTYRKLWHLLSRFDFVPTGDLSEAETQVRRLVSAYVPDDASLEDKVPRLRDLVLSYAASGNRSFKPRELLDAAGIEWTAFTKLSRARGALRERTLADMYDLVSYDRSLSVRSASDWYDGSRIRVFSGESGQGKSWSLADLAYALMDNDRGGLVVFVRASGDLATDLTRAAQRLVRDVIGYNATLSFEQLAAHVRKILPDLGDPWLTVCLDDVRSPSEIEQLGDAPLHEWKIRVALTTGPRLARHDALRSRGAVVEKVRDFTDSELREYLLRRGRSWAAIPPDVRKTMRRPLLAWLFVRDAEQWSPQNEYQLYDACWRRLSTAGNQPDDLDAVMAMLTLTQDFAAGGAYPWSLETLRDLGISPSQRRQLETVGWLRADEEREVSIWHDRLLNWAVAESIARKIRKMPDDASAIAARLREFWSGAKDDNRPRLVYVPMDVVWICASREFLSPKQLAAVIKALESNHYTEDDSLHRLLASVGPPIVPALMHRLREIHPEDEKRHGLEMSIGKAIVSALRIDRGNAPLHVLALLQADEAALRKIGIRAARAVPSGKYAPILWDLLRAFDAKPESADDGSIESTRKFWDRRDVYQALAASVPDARAWLERTILALDEPHHDAKTLAWILSSLDDAPGRDLWLKVKKKLFEVTPSEKPGGLLVCIRNYRDAEEVPRLESWLTMEHDFASPSALRALAIVAPDKAFAFVKANDSSSASNFASWWFPWLMLMRREETLTLAREQLASDASVAEWFDGNEHELDGVTTDSFIAHVSGQLQNFQALESPSARCIERAAHLLRQASHAVAIDRLRARAGTNFEERLIAIAARLPLKKRLPLRDVSEDIRVILRRVDEEAVPETLLVDLNGEEIEPALDWIPAHPTSEIRDALRTVIRRNAAEWDGHGIPDDSIRAVRALTFIGDDEGVLDAISTFGANVVDDDLPGFIADRDPMDETLVARLLDDLASDDETKRIRALGGLRISRRPALVPLILEQATAAEASLNVRYEALRAARDLVKRGTEIAALVAPIVHGSPDDVRHVLADLLFTSGTPASLDLVAELARKLPFNHVADEVILENLVDDSKRGREMAALLQSHLWPFPHLPILRNDARAWLKLFPIVANDELREKALDSALDESSSVDSLMVIKCVATFDVEAAFDLTLTALKSDRKNREVLPPYLLRFDAKRVADSLLTHLPEEPLGLVRWAIGRVLRWSVDESIPALVCEMANDPSTACREAAFDVAGWREDGLIDDELRSAALNDQSYKVRVAATDSLRRRQRIRQAAELRERLIASSGSHAWTYAEALTTYGDPYLLSRDGDPLSIWTALKGASGALAIQVEKWLRRRCKEVDRAAETEGSIRGRDDR